MKAVIGSQGLCGSLFSLLLIVSLTFGAISAVMPVFADEQTALKATACEGEAAASSHINTLAVVPQGQASPLSAAYFSDAQGTLDLDAVPTQHFQDGSCISSFPVPPPGGVLWFRFDVANPYATSVRWFITTMELVVDDIRLYERTPDDLAFVSRNGRTTAYLERPAKTGKLAVPLTLNPGESKTFYLRISGMFAPKVTPLIISPDLLADLSKAINNISLSVIGFLAMMAVVSLILYRHVAPGFSRLYTGYMACQLALALIYHDWLAQIPFMNLPVSFVARWTMFCGGVGTLILVFFCRALLETDKSSMRREWLYRTLLVIGGFVVVLVVVDPRMFSGPYFLLRTFVPLALMLLSLRAHHAGLVHARWVAAGLAALVFGLGVGAYGFLSPAEIGPTSSVFDLIFMRPLNMTYFIAVFSEPVFMMVAISVLVRTLQTQRQSAVVEVESLQQHLKTVESEYSEVQRTIIARVKTLEAALADDPDRKQNLSVEQQFLERATELVLDHVGETGFDVNELASELGISQKTLGRRLKELHGMTSAAFIRSVRLSFARDLILLRRYKSVGEVARAAGFASVGHFSKLYRTQFDETPSESLKNLEVG